MQVLSIKKDTVMKKKILILAFCCSAVFLQAQDVKKDSLAGVQLKHNLLLIDSIYKAFNNEKEVQKKEIIFNDFFGSPRSQQPGFARYKTWMQRDLVQHYAAINDVGASNSWLAKITDQRVKAEALRLAAAAYADAGNKAQGIKMLKPVLDSIIQSDGNLNKADLNTYTYAVPIYVKMLDKGEEKEVLRYLKPLYQTSGGYFPSDMSGKLKPDFNIKEQLFYQYAKALSAEGNEKEVARIISQAFQLGAVPSSLQSQVLSDFSHVRHLDQYLKEFNTEGKGAFQKNLNSLLDKPDADGKVWGAASMKGKYLLLDFWGSWCLPCRFTHPHLKEVYSKYKNKGFEIVGISLEPGPELEKANQTWKKAIAEDKISWIHLLNNENAGKFDAVKAFGVGVFPTKILLDTEGKEIARYTGGASKDFDEKMKVLFGF